MSMVHFFINNREIRITKPGEMTLLQYLRNHEGIVTVKDGCSGEAACGACLVEIDGKPRLSCTQKLEALDGCRVVTLDGIPSEIKHVIAKAFVEKGAVQCGFCTPGLIMRTRLLYEENPHPDRHQIKKAIKPHLCRCTGYVKIVDAMEEALHKLKGPISKAEAPLMPFKGQRAGIGHGLTKYTAYETATGQRLFVDDMKFPGLLYGALRFSDHPRAKIISVDTRAARSVEGVVAVFTATDVPGDRFTGLIFSDWPLMIAEGEVTRYIGDVLAGVVAADEATARKAAALVDVKYEVLEPVSDPASALEPGSPEVHPGRSNLLETCIVRRGGLVTDAFEKSQYTVSGTYKTQRIEHAFLESEAAIAMPEGKGLRLYSQGQGIYVDQRQVAGILGIDESDVRVTLVPCGGGFGGREDMTVQGHAGLFAWMLKAPVKVHLSRSESIRMHPKRHPVTMDIILSCDEKGMLTGMKMLATGDTGAYASVGTKVMERVAGHATGAYHVPSVDIEAKTVYTNNIPSGAMRGFGANQAAFALESCIDELCKAGGFDRWQFRYQNALEKGKMTATGQILGDGVGVKACLEALKPYYDVAKYTGLACGIKNSGVGNGMTDFSDVRITIRQGGTVLIEHGWTEMGQGIHNMAIQVLHQETGIDPDLIEVVVDTDAGLPTGMTTSSRATALLGNAIIDAATAIRSDIDQFTPGCLDPGGKLLKAALVQMAGSVYTGKYYCDWTTKPGAESGKVITHYSYGYAAQLVELDETGKVSRVIAAHDAGKVMNPLLFEGQIEGAVHMGLGYALTEDLPMESGQLVSDKLHDCGVIPATETPDIVVIGVEEADPVGPYGAKGVGEIGLVPTAAAVANALCAFDGIRRKELPMQRKEKYRR
jgi:selenium-dependent xanthine dehydrogenase